MDRWLFAIMFVGSVTYTAAAIVRRLARPRPQSAANARSSRAPHAHPMTPTRYTATGTAEECEAIMRKLTNGERGCASPSEHRRSTR